MRQKDGHKKHHCCFCNQVLWQLPRHFRRCHKNEKEVAKALEQKKNSKERREIWKMLTRRGDFSANIKSFQEGTEIICMVRESKKTDPVKALPCEFCKGFFAPNKVKAHENTCFLKNSFLKPSTAGSRLMKEVSVIGNKYKEVFKKVLVRMKQDEIMSIIKKDELLLLFGTVELNKKEEERYQDIGYTLRVIAKVLNLFRKETKMNEVSSQDLVYPANYDQVVKVMFQMSKFEGPRKIKTPHIVLKVGYSLKTLCLIVRVQNIKSGNVDVVEKCRCFLELYESDYSIHASNARAVYQKRKANVPEDLPLESDIKILRDLTVSKIKKIVSSYKGNEQLSVPQYKELLQLTFVRVLTFNARRGGEPSKLTLDDWKNVESDIWKKKADIEKLENPVEKVLAKRLKICYIEGKKKKRGSQMKALVPIIFTEEVTSAIQVLVKNRSSTNISADSHYIFPSGSGLKRIRGWDALQSIAKKLPLSKPSLLTPTRTRKFLATTLQLLDLTDAEITWVTNHMGHTRNVHFSWYRQEESTIELTKIAKLLLAVDSNESLKNKKIDDLCNTPGSSSSKSKKKKLVKKKQDAIGWSQGKVLFVMFKLICRT